MARRLLTLYDRVDCHLCREMRLRVAAWARGGTFELRVVDVDGDPALAELYGYKVPVLVEGDYEICHYFLDEEALADHLAGPPRSGTLREATRYERIYAIARQVPPGRVATYGQIAAIEGNASARQVGYAMAAVTDAHAVPWQRVINSQGTVSERAGGGGTSRQRRLLQAEGVPFDARGRVDL